MQAREAIRGDEQLAAFEASFWKIAGTIVTEFGHLQGMSRFGRLPA
jgi:hypothetical protein